jgi:hypothetical protein
MGFFNSLGRLLQGKPVFQDETPKSETPSAQPLSVSSKQSPLVNEYGYKNIPHISLEHVKAHRAGDDMTVTGWVTNHSDRRIRVDHVLVLGQKQIFQRELEPGKGHELTVYKGKCAHNEYEAHAELVFRISENGDLFKNAYHVEFNRESDGKFVVEEFHEDSPVQDI